MSAPATVVRLDIENGNHVPGLKSDEEVSARCVLIPTGASYRKLHVARYEQFERSGVYHTAAAVEAQLCRGAQVVIIGGANPAGQAAFFLSEHSTKVLLIIREEDLKISMSHYLIRRIEQTANIEVRSGT